MAELHDGERSFDHNPAPGEREYTFHQLRKHLRCGTGTLRNIIASLGIHRGPLERKDWYYQKMCKKRLRFITQAEAELIMERYHALMGRKEEET